MSTAEAHKKQKVPDENVESVTSILKEMAQVCPYVLVLVEEWAANVLSSSSSDPFPAESVDQSCESTLLYQCKLMFTNVGVLFTLGLWHCELEFFLRSLQASSFNELGE